ncbi:MAG: hypothetical protein ACFCVH_03860 [Alphaproteobacteria bacterium]
MEQWLRLDQQPTLREMLDDPLVIALMDRDRVTRHEVEALMRGLRTRHGVRSATPVAPAPARRRLLPCG